MFPGLCGYSPEVRAAEILTDKVVTRILTTIFMLKKKCLEGILVTCYKRPDIGI